MSTVTVVKAQGYGKKERYKAIYESLKPIEKDIRGAVKGKDMIIIKPNLVSVTNQLAATHSEHIKAILDFLTEFWNKPIVIAESAALGRASDGYKNYGYSELKKEYDIELLDLDDYDYEYLAIIDKEFKPIEIKVSKIMLSNKNYIISAAKIKTHDTVVTTLSLKNVVMGSILSCDKQKMHQGIKQINYNLFLLAKALKPSLAVMDGVVGMQGNGPVNGYPINLGVAVSSLDFLAADKVCCDLMGINFENVGYLYYCWLAGMGNVENIKIVGSSVEQCRKKFKLHDTVEEQYKWKDKRIIKLIK